MGFFTKKRVTDLADVEKRRAYDQERIKLATEAGVEQARRELKNPPKKTGFTESITKFARSGKAFSASPVFGTPYSPYAKPKPVTKPKIVYRYRTKKRRR